MVLESLELTVRGRRYWVVRLDKETWAVDVAARAGVIYPTTLAYPAELRHLFPLAVRVHKLGGRLGAQSWGAWLRQPVSLSPLAAVGDEREVRVGNTHLAPSPPIVVLR